MSFWGGLAGIAQQEVEGCWISPHLLESLVVDKASGIFWYVKLAFLDVFAELPAMLVVSRLATA